MANGDLFAKHLASFPHNTPVDVTVTRHRRPRSVNQNRYYWGVVLNLIADHTGHTEEELHEIYKRKFLPARIVHYNGVDIRMPTSTPDTDTLEFTNYIERIRAEAGMMGITIPDPEQVRLH